jgi:hypothetical protein
VTNPLTVARSGDLDRPIIIGLDPGDQRLTIDQALRAASVLIACAAEAHREEKQRAIEHQRPPRCGTLA